MLEFGRRLGVHVLGPVHGTVSGPAVHGPAVHRPGPDHGPGSWTSLRSGLVLGPVHSLVLDLAMDRVMDWAMGRVMGWTMDRVMDRAMDRAMDQLSTKGF